MEVNPWPDIPSRHRWTIELMEDRLRLTQQTPAELRKRACELRSEAASTDIPGFRAAVIALADRYDEAAATRLPAL